MTAMTMTIIDVRLYSDILPFSNYTPTSSRRDGTIVIAHDMLYLSSLFVHAFGYNPPDMQ
jgi:hypothetical protein